MNPDPDLSRWLDHWFERTRQTSVPIAAESPRAAERSGRR